MLPIKRKTANFIINCMVGFFVGTGVAVAIIAAVFGVPVWVSVVFGTILLLLWIATFALWMFS